MSEIWSSLAGIGAILAVGVSTWAVIVAHKANKIAKKALPVPQPEFEVRRGPGIEFVLTNVGDAALYEITLQRTGGAILHSPQEEVTKLEPGDSLRFAASSRGLREHLTFELQGVEIREGVRIDRVFPMSVRTQAARP